MSQWQNWIHALQSSTEPATRILENYMHDKSLSMAIQTLSDRVKFWMLATEWLMRVSCNCDFSTRSQMVLLSSPDYTMALVTFFKFKHKVPWSWKKQCPRPTRCHAVCQAACAGTVFQLDSAHMMQNVTRCFPLCVFDSASMQPSDCMVLLTLLFHLLTTSFVLKEAK